MIHSAFERSTPLRLAVATLFAVMLLSACRTVRAPENRNAAEPPPVASGRDWVAHPAIVERTTSSEIVALGDVHGGYDRLVHLLTAGGLIAADGGKPGGYVWAGGQRILVCTGDLIDKGDKSIEVLDLMMSLEEQARAAGGEVVVMLGNHEAEFLADPSNDKAVEFRAELSAKGIDPAAIASGASPYGAWLKNRPFAAKVNDWFFAHGGNTNGESIAELSADFKKAVDAGKWDAKSIIGEDSLLEARLWWEQGDHSKKLIEKYLEAVGANHIVFGHDPSAFGDKGVMTAEKDGRLILIDVGMSPAIDYSQGALLFIDRDGATQVATSLDASGARKVLWKG
jgi:hypothetical protein